MDFMVLGIQNNDNRVVLFDGGLYSSIGGQIKRYDLQKRDWQKLDIPEEGDCNLFAVDGHLFTTGQNTIVEIRDNGKSTRILASARRRPAASILDSLSSLGSPVLFSGLNHTLCASIGNASFGRQQFKVFSWDGNDWREMFGLKTSRLAEVFEDAVVFRYADLDSLNYPSMVWLWDKHQAAPELALYEEAKNA